MPQNFVIFRDFLDKQLENQEFKKKFEKERDRFRIEVMINDLLQDSGLNNYRVELVENEDDYYN